MKECSRLIQHHFKFSRHDELVKSSRMYKNERDKNKVIESSEIQDGPTTDDEDKYSNNYW